MIVLNMFIWFAGGLITGWVFHATLQEYREYRKKSIKVNEKINK